MAHSEQAIWYLEECLPIFQELHLTGHEEQALRALSSCRATAEAVAS